MKETAIVAIETLTSSAYPQLLHVVVETADGKVGVGETFHNPLPIEAYIQTVVAPALLGTDALDVAGARLRIGSRFNGGNVPPGVTTVDSSAISATDIALWDLRGKVLDIAVCDLLGGRTRSAVRAYNTCAGPGEGMPARGAQANEPGHSSEPWAFGGGRGEYDDYTAMWERPAELAQQLVSEGFSGMKLYTFRPAARETLGTYVTTHQVREAVAPLVAIREAVGNEIELMMDMVFDWTFAPARRIISALDEFDLLWIEDPLRWGARRFLPALQQSTKIPLAAFDNGVGLETYLNLMQSGSLALLRIDPQWCGGITEARRIADTADSFGLGVIFHDCAGPISFLASTHLAVHCPNTVFQESVRGYWRLVYPAIVSDTPVLIDGLVSPPNGPGLGASLADHYLKANTTTAHRTELRNGLTVRVSP